MTDDPAIGEILVEQDVLAARVQELAAEVSRDYAGKDLLLIGVLKGAVFFVADLMRALDIQCEVDFMAVASYGSLDQVLRRRADPQGPRRRDRGPSRADRRGHRRLRADAAVPAAQPRRPQPGVARGLRAAASSPSSRKVDLEPRYVGFEIPDKFVVGYGLDHAERYRNLPYVAVLDANSCRRSLWAPNMHAVWAPRGRCYAWPFPPESRLEPHRRQPGARTAIMSRFFKSAAFPILIVVVLAFFASKLVEQTRTARRPPTSARRSR